jgi:AcrR family transcriptional regulator
VANRARIVAAARRAFDAAGPLVSLDAIAREAGVGPGTVHRHFPTKAALVDAVLGAAVADIVADADARRGSDEPVEALLSFLEELVVSGAAAHDLADRLGAGGDVGPAVAQPLAELKEELRALLERAQRAGGVRTDLDEGALAAVVAAGHAAYVHPTGGRLAARVVLDGLRVRPS